MENEKLAVVLAGGLGTRLRPVYRQGPKSMAPVAGRPFLEYLLLWLRSAGIGRVILCVGYKRLPIERWFGRGKKWGLEIAYAVEQEPLGTAGALKAAEKLINTESFFVLNGDSFLDVDLRAMSEFHHHQNSRATIALAQVKDPDRYGSVSCDPQGRVVGFVEKGGAPEDSRDAPYINGGVYLLDRKILKDIPAGRAVSIEKEIFPALVGGDLYGFPASGYFVDIGVPHDFERAQLEFPKRFRYDHPG